MILKNILIAVLLACFAMPVSAQKNSKKNKHKTAAKSNKKGGETDHALTIIDACKREEAVQKIKADMTPFRMDRITTKKVFYKSYDHLIELAVPIFHNTDYKFIFNSEGLPTGITIKIKDKPHKVSSSKELKLSTEKHFVYETPADFEGSRIYLVIKVPADKEYQNGVRNKGCIIIGTGYSDLDF